MNGEEFLRLVAPAMLLATKKGDDYNTGPTLHQYFPFGDFSYIQMIHLKALRLVAIVDKVEPNYEGKLDTVYDLINYCVFYLQYLEDHREL